MINTKFKITLHILIFLIFNTFLAQSKNELREGVNTDTIKREEQLSDILFSKAESSSFDIKKNTTYLRRKAQVKYQDMQIEADYISIDWETGTLFARGKMDSLGRIFEPAIATQGGKNYEYNEVSYNYKTRQAIAYNARTEESEGLIVARKNKK